MTVNFNLFLDSRHNLDTLPAKEEALLQGAVFEHSGLGYHVQMLSTQTPDGDKARLIFRTYTTTKHEIRYFDEGAIGKVLYIGKKMLDERAVPLTQTFYNIILLGTITEDTGDLIFEGELTPEETEFYETHQELMPPKTDEVEIEYAYNPDSAAAAGAEPSRVPLNTGWTRPQKASLLVITVLATMTIVYGAKKAVNHFNLKTPKVPTLEDLKASLEKLRNWRKGAETA